MCSIIASRHGSIGKKMTRFVPYMFCTIDFTRLIRVGGHQDWGPLKMTRVELRFKKLRMALDSGDFMPVYGDTGMYMMHLTGATIHAPTKKLLCRLAHHISFHEERDLLPSRFDIVFDRTLLPQGEGYLGRVVPPTHQDDRHHDVPMTEGPQLFRNDQRRDTTELQVQTRQLQMVANMLASLEELTASFAPQYNWNSRYARLRGMLSSVQMVHRVRFALSPVGQDLGDLD